MSTALVSACFRGTLGRFELNAQFEVQGRGITGLFGPSGCGKTSVMRCIAGLNRLKDGFCAVDGEIWQDATYFRPVHERPIGFVFQEASLFPHLSVRRNLTYGRPAAETKGIELDRVVDLLGIGKLLDRSPRNLSGGERQRVAIGRALLSQPKLLLMDEPLSALDQMTKDEILPYLEELHAAMQLPILYISHDMAEVERLADQLVLMDAGSVLATGPIGALQADLSLPFALSHDAAVSLDTVAQDWDPADGLATLATEGGTILVPSKSVRPGERRRLRVLADDVSLAREDTGQSTIVNVLPARIISARDTPDHRVIAVIALGENGTGARLLSRVTRRSWIRLDLQPGLAVFAQIKGASLVRREDRSV